MRFRLRYLHHDLALGDGQFVLGRSAGCQLSLDDALISRRHAAIVVAGDAVTIEDLGSRNGVVVNGRRISEKTELTPGDRIVVGAQELTLLEAQATLQKETRSFPVSTATLPRIPAVADVSVDRPEPSERTAAGADDPPPGDDSSMVRRVTAFKLLGGVADKALAMGRVDEAERLLTGPLNEVIEASRAGKGVSPWIVDIAAHLAAKLATATAKGAWADYVVEVYQSQGRPCTAPVVDELYSALRKVNAVDLARLRAYLAGLREKAATLGPAERFLIQRIEGLERLAALR